MKFIKSVTIRNKNTARQYHLRLSLFAKFIQEKYKIDLDKFLQQLKRQGADLETKIEELQDINQILREKDKMKEDVIANLSDKLIMLSERLDIIERSK